MSSGHRQGDAPASAAAVVRVLQANPGLRGFLGSFSSINRSYRVPYLAGRSIDGSVTYIDCQVPERLPKSGVEPDEHYADHEGFEWWLMVMRGMDYERAHRLAHGFEQYRMRLAGISDERIEQYEKESSALVNIDEHVKLGPEAFPPDLYLGPYESDPDSLDKRLLPLLRGGLVAHGI